MRYDPHYDAAWTLSGRRRTPVEEFRALLDELRRLLRKLPAGSADRRRLARELHAWRERAAFPAIIWPILRAGTPWINEALAEAKALLGEQEQAESAEGNTIPTSPTTTVPPRQSTTAFGGGERGSCGADASRGWRWSSPARQ